MTMEYNHKNNQNNHHFKAFHNDEAYPFLNFDFLELSALKSDSFSQELHEPNSAQTNDFSLRYPQSNDFQTPSQIPDMDMEVISSFCFTDIEEVFISYNQDTKVHSTSMRASLEKMVNDDSSPGETKSVDISLDRDPSELYGCQPLEWAYTPVSGEMDADSEFLQSQLEMPQCKKPSEKGKKDHQEKRPNSRQSKFKNTYSLAEEHARRLIKDWLTLDGQDMKRLKVEERKSNAVRLQEEKKIQSDFEEFQNIDKECDDIRKTIKLLKESEVPVLEAELDELKSKQHQLLAKKKTLQKDLMKKLYYKRFNLVSRLSTLVSESRDAFIKKSELLACLKKNPKTRALTCMRSFFRENIKFGLVVLRTAMVLLPPTEICSTHAFQYWLVKSPMEWKTKELFVKDLSRTHIRYVLEQVYLELRNIAYDRVSNEEMLRFDESFNSSDATIRPNINRLVDGFDFEQNQYGKRSLLYGEEDQDTGKKWKRR